LLGTVSLSTLLGTVSLSNGLSKRLSIHIDMIFGLY
jgi:hypothetical protein